MDLLGEMLDDIASHLLRVYTSEMGLDCGFSSQSVPSSEPVQSNQSTSDSSVRDLGRVRKLSNTPPENQYTCIPRLQVENRRQSRSAEGVMYVCRPESALLHPPAWGVDCGRAQQTGDRVGESDSYKKRSWISSPALQSSRILLI